MLQIGIISTSLNKSSDLQIACKQPLDVIQNRFMSWILLIDTALTSSPTAGRSQPPVAAKAVKKRGFQFDPPSGAEAETEPRKMTLKAPAVELRRRMWGRLSCERQLVVGEGELTSGGANGW